MIRTISVPVLGTGDKYQERYVLCDECYEVIAQIPMAAPAAAIIKGPHICTACEIRDDR